MFQKLTRDASALNVSKLIRVADVVSFRVAVSPAEHELRVTMTVTDVAGVLRVESPTWVPGDYEFVTLGRDIFGVTATDPSSGARLRVRRSGWQGYDIEAA